jgi:pyruvate dehydrogenase E2 component (dihydrolipoamide acetyltransferase)|tara:strand:+ start:5466 stop:6374 length:909 start_codon:yes stop_codon:yes gene_type:complete
MTEKIFSSPKVRKFARELGADLSGVIGSERKGRITEDDVKEIIKNKLKEEKLPILNKKTIQEYTYEEFGEVEIVDLPRIKKLAAPHLQASWSNIPHVTHHDEADITELELFRRNLKDNFTGMNKKITPLAFIIKALTKSLINFPIFNSSIKDIEKGIIVQKKYFHIGIAVDTPHGLMVPKIRDTNKKNINNIANELKIVSEKSKNLKIEKKEFFGGSITVTSLGGIGGTFFTPIINSPEVAILGIGKMFDKFIDLEKNPEKRFILPISLSYDHRVINGADAARFCNNLKENLGQNFAYNLSI